jgi:hypothetical protein
MATSDRCTASLSPPPGGSPGPWNRNSSGTCGHRISVQPSTSRAAHVASTAISPIGPASGNARRLACATRRNPSQTVRMIVRPSRAPPSGSKSASKMSRAAIAIRASPAAVPRTVPRAAIEAGFYRHRRCGADAIARTGGECRVEQARAGPARPGDGGCGARCRGAGGRSARGSGDRPRGSAATRFEHAPKYGYGLPEAGIPPS